VDGERLLDRVGLRVSVRERVAAEVAAKGMGWPTSVLWRRALAEFLTCHGRGPDGRLLRESLPTSRAVEEPEGGPVRPMSDDEMQHIA
jgi:hypothetical protein